VSNDCKVDPTQDISKEEMSSIIGTLKFHPRLGVSMGMYAELKRVISATDVSTYSALLGDTNPLHLDAAFAATTRWGRPIAHGMISAGLFPTLFGASIPACVYVSQTLRFRRPVYVGDAVIARVTVRDVRLRGGAQMATCETIATLEASGAVVVDGEAVVLLPPFEPFEEMK
jgi:3-hydroxybutyryl-CoA dehydratase